jgi:cell wall-associated NlpC family hydrolase
MAIAEHATLRVDGPGGPETHAFASAAEAAARAAFINEALSWVGTPFQDCADVKGPHGCVDCAMLLVRSAVDTGRFPPFDPRPYPPRWHLHRGEERFIGWIAGTLGAAEVVAPRVGDVVLWQFGRCFSHGAVLINATEVVHAYYAAGTTLVSRLQEPLLDYISDGRLNIRRPVKYFDLWRPTPHPQSGGGGARSATEGAQSGLNAPSVSLSADTSPVSRVRSAP